MSDNLLTVPSANDVVLERNGYFHRVWYRFVSRVTAILTGREPVRIKTSTVAGLPAAADWRGCVVIVTDEADGEVPAWSDGSTWRRMTDRAEVTT